MKNFPDWILFFSVAVLLVVSFFIIRSNARGKIDLFIKSKRNLIVLILGQSNAANYGEHLNSSDKNIFMYFQKRIYKAKDPILGASGKKGSIWLPVFDQLLKTREFDSILIVNIAQGSSSVEDWQPNGMYHERLQGTLTSLQEKNLEPDFILWQQGEQDNLNGMSKEDYKRAFRKIHGTVIRFDDQIPILISITSFHPSSATPVSSEIREAQYELIQENECLFLGPDTDVHVAESRYDGIHFSTKGMNSVSKDWAESIDDFLDLSLNSESKKVEF